MIEEMPNKATLDFCQHAWSLSNPIFVRKQENIVYICQRAGKNVFLRLTTPLRRSKSLIQAEIEFITHLAKAGIRVPQPIENNLGQIQMSVAQGNQQYEIVVFSQVSGMHPSEQLIVTPDYLKSLGALIASMHNAATTYQPQLSRREQWFEERGIRHALEATKTSVDTLMQEQLNETLSWIKSLPQTNDTYGLIHADIGPLNLFISPHESIGVIDFDDSCYHFFIFDLAIAIYSIGIKLMDIKWDWINYLVEGYKTTRHLPEKEIEQIPQFIKFACLRLYFWIEYHENLSTFHIDHIEPALKMKAWCFKIINQDLVLEYS